MAKPQYWQLKSEPSVYAYARLETDGRTEWTGVRDFEARNNIRAMKPGDTRGRLSVAPVTAELFKRILEQGGSKLPRGR